MNEDEPETRAIAPHAAHYGTLLGLARAAIGHYLATGQLMSFHTDNGWFLSPAAVFVTLRIRNAPGSVGADEDAPRAGDLRGCIGQIEADAPLYAAVEDAAIKAATSDPRFYPVTPEELDNLRIEISVLSPMRPVETIEDVLVGQDGLLIIGDRRRGLLLPEVPLAYGWGREAFVRALCRKAGLPEDAWPGRARLYAFTTESFEES